MKIWVIGRGFPSKKNRMLGSFELEQAKMLADENDVTYIAQIFTYLPSKGTPGVLYKTFMDENVRVCCRTVPYFPHKFKIYLKNYIRHTWDKMLRKIEDQFGTPDVIHIHYPTMIAIGVAIYCVGCLIYFKATNNRLFLDTLDTVVHKAFKRR